MLYSVYDKLGYFPKTSDNIYFVTLQA